ncbi:uncharacterized protein K452DRAFT_358113 [Aplosporella prunicola CBS 121167]|uniref:Receptor L-domain domain-containing protein n=1 Tax=Aplosporella prunicola CBS 121167 TaxID=1176127 RepID=A0A6A6BI49_9PEZI|nr:uncharacterized protein K452DRAFT_358113 [Aplosporella prunicola CBS 121167]KAF2143103.1 hypothetical protein K452DRAFT_358113 [Aplosporella prunicola CBS 121167]
MKKAILLGALLLGFAWGDSCGTGATTTIRPPATETGCKTYTGSIAVATDVQTDPEWLRFVEEVSGSIIVHNHRNMVTLWLSHLHKASTISVKDQSSLSFAALDHLEELDNLECISNLVIADTTIPAIHDVSNSRAFSRLETAETIRLELNLAMKEVNLPVLKSVSKALIIGDNGEGSHIYFPRLEWARSVTVRDNGRHHPYSHGTLELPRITDIKGPLRISNNPSLERVLLPMLENIEDDLRIENNPSLQAISFENLVNVDGDILLRGDFETIAFPALLYVGGSLTASSTHANFSCAQLDDLRLYVNGDVLCQHVPPAYTHTPTPHPTPARRPHAPPNYNPLQHPRQKTSYSPLMDRPVPTSILLLCAVLVAVAARCLLLRVARPLLKERLVLLVRLAGFVYALGWVAYALFAFSGLVFA